MVAEVKALACELPARLGLPLSRFSRADLRRYVLAAGIVAEISGITIWRWLHEDALRPWSRRSWIFPRDPDFGTKAGPVLDLYHRRWKGRTLADDDFVISADEKTQIPIRTRCHPILPPGPGRPIRVEHEYRRHGVCAYIAAWQAYRSRRPETSSPDRVPAVVRYEARGCAAGIVVDPGLTAGRVRAENKPEGCSGPESGTRRWHRELYDGDTLDMIWPRTEPLRPFKYVDFGPPRGSGRGR